jgi:hypothetical protein
MNFAILGCTMSQSMEGPPEPLSSITVGEPCPLQSMSIRIAPAWTRYPRFEKRRASLHVPMIW